MTCRCEFDLAAAGYEEFQTRFIMRVLLHAVPTLGQATGVGHYQVQLLRALVELKIVKRLAVFDGAQVVDVDEFLSRTHLARFEAITNRMVGALPHIRRLAHRVRTMILDRLVRRGEWTLLHEPNYVPPDFAGPIVTTVHDLSYIRYPEFLPNERLRYLQSSMAASLERSRAIITISQFTRRELLELYPGLDPAQVFVTPLGVDRTMFSSGSSPGLIEATRRRLGLPPRFILHLGTLEPRKNLQGLLRAYQLLPPALRKEYPLVLAGMRGWKQSYFRELLKSLSRDNAVQVIGYVERQDVPLVMKTASVFCFPSYYEGFGLPPLEAAACGTPVVCSRTASLPEVMGDAAEYVDPDSPESIAHGLQRVLDDSTLATRLRERGLHQAATFSWQKCAEATLNAYRAVA